MKNLITKIFLLIILFYATNLYSDIGAGPHTHNDEKIPLIMDYNIVMEIYTEEIYITNIYTLAGPPAIDIRSMIDANDNKMVQLIEEEKFSNKNKKKILSMFNLNNDDQSNVQFTNNIQNYLILNDIDKNITNRPIVFLTKHKYKIVNKDNKDNFNITIKINPFKIDENKQLFFNCRGMITSYSKHKFIASNVPKYYVLDNGLID